MTNINLLLPKNATQFFINGPAGLLDTLELIPKGEIRGIAIIFHPDPKGGGTYTNKIVQTVAKVMNSKGYVSFCPNLRGVGLSDGVHDFGNQEIEDARAVYQYAINKYPNLPVVIAGFSFGTSIASNLASNVDYQKLVLIGPAVTRYSVIVPDINKVLVIHGQEDEVISLNDVFSWAKDLNVPVSVFLSAGHFFHGKLVELQNYLNQVIGVE